MMRRLSLRARLAVLTSLAVAVAVAACAVGCWFLVRGRLIDQLDQSLSAPNPALAGGPHDHPPGGQQTDGGPGGNTGSPRDLCRRPFPENDRFKDFLPTVQVEWADGTSCTPSYISDALKPAAVDLTVAAGRRDHVFRDGTTRSGTPMRVFVRRDRTTDAAVLVARPLSQVSASLNSLALLLVAVAAIGVVGAATAGLLIARAGLRPVDRLTDAVEHIARTEDLDTAIPAEGTDEIARLGRSFNSMTRALAGSRDRQQQLIVDAGHELRTPLTSLRTNVDLMLRSETTGRPLPAQDKRRLLVNIKAQLLELTSLVGDLLDLSRPEKTSDAATEDGPAIEEDGVALHDVVGSAVRRARLRGPGLHVESTTEPWYVRGEAAALERAVVNLLDNAVKFSPPGGVVTVRLRGGVLTVRDQGPGIPAADLPHVFDRFWRSPSARGLPGSGLGLAIVARAVRAAGGQVRLGPADGGGTMASLALPGTPAPPQGAELGGDETGVGVMEAGRRTGGEHLGGLP